MIIDVKKYVILGAKEDLNRFFERAQQRGILEFISLAKQKPIEAPIEIQRLYNSMRILRKLPVKVPYEGSLDLSLAEKIANEILSTKEELEHLFEEKRLLIAEIARIAPFGDFSLDDIDFIEDQGKIEIQFFCTKSGREVAAQSLKELILVGSDYGLDYFISIHFQARHYPDMIEMRIDRSLSNLKSRLQEVTSTLHEMEAKLKENAKYLGFLHEAYLEHLNGFNLASAKSQVVFPMQEAPLFAIEAWVPINKIQTLYAIIDKMAIHCEQIQIEESDQVPTYMENKGLGKIGEDLVRIYDVPALTDQDPSSWVFWFFALFFAMIVADGGYGLIYLALCLYLKYKYPALKGSARRFLKLGTILASSCVIWGIFTSAFFGIQLTPKTFLGKLSVIRYLADKKADYHWEADDDVKQYWVNRFPNLSTTESAREFLDKAQVKKDHKIKYEMLDDFTDNILLEFSLMIGVIHIAFAFFRYLFRHWAGIGWVAFMIGAYLYCPSMLNATSLLHIFGVINKTTGPAFGLQLIYSGLIAALFLAIVQKRWKGLGEIANMIQVFADVLSYLRLYALGLAGSIMASTFNEIGQNVGLFLGVLVILLGHGVNILLGIMAGMIHGLRLNFIEWYHYCFDGGGRLFRPLLRLKTKEQS